MCVEVLQPRGKLDKYIKRCITCVEVLPQRGKLDNQIEVHYVCEGAAT